MFGHRGMIHDCTNDKARQEVNDMHILHERALRITYRDKESSFEDPNPEPSSHA